MISMVTCIYNRAQLLENTLISIYKQQHKNDWEIVIIDDGSTDDVKSVFKNYRKKMPLRMFRTKRNKYLNVAYPANCGVKQAKGEFILYASPEVLHVGNTFDTIHDTLKKYDSIVYATAYNATAKDNYWISTNHSWYDNIRLLDKFRQRPELIGPNNRRNGRPMYFLGGWRKDTYLRIGGMNEAFRYVGYEDNEFIFRLQYHKIPFINLFKYPIYGIHQYHKRQYLNEKNQYYLKQSRNLCRQLKKKIDNHEATIAHVGTEWGKLPQNSEIL